MYKNKFVNKIFLFYYCITKIVYYYLVMVPGFMVSIAVGGGGNETSKRSVMDE
jgi:hypothetical protein